MGVKIGNLGHFLNRLETDLDGKHEFEHLSFLGSIETFTSNDIARSTLTDKL